ncbi:Gfo/Idh/MocA family oxidoreductase [Herbiconiux sp. KACC 21604]|uniref:Gfo/Idh/MocA family oxidoreductase n=1 Tax=unclassified Herbiconiux TaxID=2618217 RepID=UPI0014919A23|nr:Gfo/Idh/MocA family oxidoreductase [Herbiconiux sp. SALV-R1]QJU55245.1 Gfo/Idh/MocA family oxidoreductase [Herbiconiux sp. SALV-R1]WPO86412.1 Gfo/Idh/MocA family oxidoreductase [Herbiconiux sp. KACC 21604]
MTAAEPRSVRVGVIGAGIMGADHARIIDAFVGSARVEAVADVDRARAQAVAERIAARHGTSVRAPRVSPDARSLIDDPEVDAVIIASHDSTHAELALACLAAGKPVLCEKPLAPTVEECRRVVEADDRAAALHGRRLVSVGFMRRFDPAYAEQKAAVTAGDIGTPLLVHGISRGVSSAPGSTSEGSITGSAIHEFDTIPWLLDSPITAVSWQAPRATGTETGLQDPQVMLIRTADGVLSTLETFLNARYGYDILCEVVGETGTRALRDPARVVAKGSLATSLSFAPDWRQRFEDAYRLELTAWITALQDGSESPLATARDGLAATAVAAAAISSMNSDGRWVQIDD